MSLYKVHNCNFHFSSDKTHITISIMLDTATWIRFVFVYIVLFVCVCVCFFFFSINNILLIIELLKRTIQTRLHIDYKYNTYLTFLNLFSLINATVPSPAPTTISPVFTRANDVTPKLYLFFSGPYSLNSWLWTLICRMSPVVVPQKKQSSSSATW